MKKIKECGFLPASCFAVVITILFLCSCSNFLDTAQNGAVTIQLPSWDNSDETTSRQVIVQASKEDIRSFVLDFILDGASVRQIDAKAGTTITVDNLSPGKYTVQGKAYNKDGTALAFGTASVTVIAGETASATLALSLEDLKLTSLEADLSPAVYTLGETFPDLGNIYAVYTNSFGGIARRQLTADDYSIKIDGSDRIVALSYNEILFQITINTDVPVIAEPEKSVVVSVETSTTLTVDASCEKGGLLSYAWTRCKAGGDVESLSTYKSKAITIKPENEDAGTWEYVCTVTNTNDSVNGNKTAEAKETFTVTVTDSSVTGIEATYIADTAIPYEIVGEKLLLTKFKISHVCDDGQKIDISAPSYKDYVLSVPENAVGDVPVTITYAPSDFDTIVSVPYKYKLEPPVVSVTEEWTVTCTPSTVPEYNVYSKTSEEISAIDAYNIDYQWYSASTSSNSDGTAISGDTGTALFPIQISEMLQKAGTNYFYCVVTFTGDQDYCADVEPVKIPSKVIAVDPTPITDYESLKTAITNGGIIIVSGDIEIPDTITISKHTIIYSTAENPVTFSRAANFVTGPLFSVADRVNFMLGGVSDNGATVSGNNVAATAPLISTMNGSLILYGVSFTEANASCSGAAISVDGADSFIQAIACKFSNNRSTVENGGIVSLRNMKATQYPNSFLMCNFSDTSTPSVYIKDVAHTLFGNCTIKNETMTAEYGNILSVNNSQVKVSVADVGK